MRKLIAAAFVMLVAGPLPAALAQSGCPSIIYGAVLTAAQWNACFGTKQDTLGFTPLNKAGDVMSGRLVTAVPGVNKSGFNLSPGSAPSAPADGDVWATPSGFYGQTGGVTYGPWGVTRSANPSVTVGLTAKNGTAGTAMRSDAAPALDQSIAPTWTGQHTFALTPVWPSQTARYVWMAPTAGGAPAFRAFTCADVSNAGTVCTINTGTSGATVGLLNGNNTYSGSANFTGTFQIGGNTVTWPAAATTVAAVNVSGQTVTGGANVISQSLASGSIAVDCGSRPLQYTVNTGAFNITAPTNDGSCILNVVNGSGAGAPTLVNFSGKSPAGVVFTPGATSSSTVTFTNGSATVGWTANGLTINAPVYFTTTGALPIGFTAGTIYYVSTTGTNTIQVSATPGGAAIAAGSAGSGTQTGVQPSVFSLSIARINGTALGAWTQVQ